MTHSQFKTKYLNRFTDYDGHFGYQCMDLMRRYVSEVHGLNPYQAIPAAKTAKICFQNFRTNRYYTKILNTPNNVPQKGDIVFWGTYLGVTGFAGHVGIFDEGNVYTFISFDQNYPTGKPCLLVKHGSSKLLHGYRGVMGWLRKK